MSIESNKALVRQACRCIHQRNVPALLELMHAEGTWSIPYRSDRFQFSGVRDKAATGKQLTDFLSGFTRFTFTPMAMTAEADRVAVECVCEGVGPGTATYKNGIHFVFIIKDGKIHTVREYLDPFEVFAYVEQWPASP